MVSFASETLIMAYAHASRAEHSTHNAELSFAVSDCREHAECPVQDTRKHVLDSAVMDSEQSMCTSEGPSNVMSCVWQENGAEQVRVRFVVDAYRSAWSPSMWMLMCAQEKLSRQSMSKLVSDPTITEPLAEEEEALTS